MKNIISKNNNGKLEQVEVRSLKSSKYFFVHRSLFVSQFSKRKEWTVTHRPSGLAVKHFTHLPDAKLYLECCELLNAYKQIAAPNDDAGIRGWKLDDEQAKNLTDCYMRICYSRLIDIQKHEEVIAWVKDLINLQKEMKEV